MDRATFWAIFSQTHLVILAASLAAFKAINSFTVNDDFSF
jgi:hypothetical protein